MLKKEKLFKQVFMKFPKSKEFKEYWSRDSGIEAYFKNKMPNVKSETIKEFQRLYQKKLDNIVWSSLKCKKCGMEWTYERQSYKEKECKESEKYICANCSGMETIKNDMLDLSNGIRIHPYKYIENLSQEEHKKIFINDTFYMLNLDDDEEYVCFENSEKVDKESEKYNLNQSGCYYERNEHFIIYFPKIKIID